MVKRLSHLFEMADETDDDATATGITYYNRSLEKGRAGYDIRHRYMSVLSYELPVGKGRRFLNRGGVVNQVLGGWDVIWPLTLQSGPPTTVTFAGSANRYLPQGVSRPNVVSRPYPLSALPHHHDPLRAAWALPGAEKVSGTDLPLIGDDISVRGTYSALSVPGTFFPFGEELSGAVGGVS